MAHANALGDFDFSSGCRSIRTKALSRRTSWSPCFAAPLGSQRGGGPKLWNSHGESAFGGSFRQPSIRP